MLANRHMSRAFVVLPVIYVLYILHRHSEYNASDTSNAIDTLAFYTHEDASAGVVETFQDHKHKISQALPAKISESIKVVPTTHPFTSNNFPEPTIDNLTHLQELCNATSWTEGLFLRCTNYCGPDRTAWCGGLNNARNRLQSCLRMAIDAGAGVILPQVVLRGTDADGLNEGSLACVDTWFDLAHIQRTMGANCPQLSIRATCPDTPTTAMAPPPQPDVPVIETDEHFEWYGRFSKGRFRDEVMYPALNSQSRLNTTTLTPLLNGTTIVQWGDTFFTWDYAASDELATVRWDLYKAMRFRKSLLEVGETIRGSAQLQNGLYIAVHLRGEIDWPDEWTPVAVQMALYKEELARIRETPEGRDISVVFISSGNQEVIQVFREMLQPLKYTVHDKWTILDNLPTELAMVQQADFDSKGIVDYVVCSQAMFFMGVCFSLPLERTFQELMLTEPFVPTVMGKHFQRQYCLHQDC